MRETSIEDFLDGSGKAGENEAGDSRKTSGGGTGGDDDEVEIDGDDDEVEIDGDDDEVEIDGDDDEVEIEPAKTTYAWTAGGADCAECGSTVERRVRDGDRLVCFDCKVW